MASMVKDVKDHKRLFACVRMGSLEFVSNLCNVMLHHFSLPLSPQTSKYLLKYLTLICLLVQLHTAKGRGKEGLKVANFPRGNRDVSPVG